MSNLTITSQFIDVSDYEPDADMVFNYLMVSALAEATDTIEKKGMKPSGGNYVLKVFSLTY